MTTGRRLLSATTRLSLGILAVWVLAGGTSPLNGQDTNPRFGIWLMESDAPLPAKNIMTYEPWGEGGMRITVESTNPEGRYSKWGYETLFDGEFRPVGGQDNAETAVEIVDDRTTKISNKRDGRVYQVIMNVLSADGNTITNEYRRTNEDGTERVSHAVYRRIR